MGAPLLIVGEDDFSEGEEQSAFTLTSEFDKDSVPELSGVEERYFKASKFNDEGFSGFG